MKKKTAAFLLLFVVIASPTIVIYHTKLWLIFRNHFDGFATLISAGVVILVYYLEQRNKKINAARLVLKEIDGAIPIAQKLADAGEYDQKTIAIATDNWPNQIHYFVKEMNQDEIDQINKIYSIGRYINRCIEKLDEYKRSKHEKIYQEAFDKDIAKAPKEIAESVDIKKTIERADTVANIVIAAAVEAAKEIKDARGWTGYNKLQQIAKLK